MKKNLLINKTFKNVLKFVFLVALIVITLLFISIYDTMLNYYEAVIKNYSQLLVDKNEQFIQIERYKYYDEVNAVSDLGALTDTDINEINQKLNEMDKTGRNIYRLAHFTPGTGAGESYLNINDILKINENRGTDPYIYRCDEIDIVEWDDFGAFFIDDITGRVPDSYNEILISNHLADLLMESGIKPYGEDDYYKPSSYESLVTSDKYFHFGVDKVRIVGIINYDLSKYENLKNISWGEYNSNREKYWATGEELSYKTQNIYNKIFVNNDFITSLIVNDSNIPGTSYPRYKINKTGILVMEDTQDGFLSLLSEFKHDEPIAARSTYSDYVDSMIVVSYWHSNILFYPVIILIILSALLISKFVLSKQDVQKLKDEKAKKLFVNKKYLWNTIPIAAISLILTSIISIFVTKYFLPVIMGEDKVNLNVFEISTRQFAVLFLSMIGIAILSYLISAVRIKIAHKNNA